jgi:hypothetical protein
MVNPWHINFGYDNNEYLINNIMINGKSLKELVKYKLKQNYYHIHILMAIEIT